MAGRSLFVSDLDNTLLGDDEALEQFAAWYDGVRSSLKLAYNSGRFPQSIRESIAATALPEPDAVIGGVGSAVHVADSAEPLPGWPAPSDRWDAGRIVELLADHPSLERQPLHLQSNFKVSYYGYDLSRESLEAIRRQLAAADCDATVIYSSQRDLDVMPASVDKGSAIAFLAEHWQIDPARVIVAGDSGNDRAMFRPPFAGIVVANALPELRALDGDRVYHARQSYAAGVLEGLGYWLQRMN